MGVGKCFVLYLPNPVINFQSKCMCVEYSSLTETKPLTSSAGDRPSSSVSNLFNPGNSPGGGSIVVISQDVSVVSFPALLLSL